MSPPRTILFLDDDAELSAIAPVVFGDAGYRVVFCSNRPDALREIEASRPIAVVVGWILPEWDAADAIREVRHLIPGIPTVVIAAHLDEQMLDRVRALGVDDALVMPWDVETLLGIVERVIGWRSARPGSG